MLLMDSASSVGWLNVSADGVTRRSRSLRPRGMDMTLPEFEPYDLGMLDVGDGKLVHCVLRNPG